MKPITVGFCSALIAGTALMAQGPAGPPPKSLQSLDGTWRMVSRSWTVGDSALYPTARYAQPGQLIIAGHYYSLMHVTTDTPRPLLPTDRDPTDAELARAFNTFYATGGRFERTDSTVTMHVAIAKYPNNMIDRQPIVQFWELRADTLWLSRRDQVSSADPRTARPVVRRTTYVRAP